jgi:hypothetical protein
MDRVAGMLEIWRTDDTHEIVINYCAANPDIGEPNKVVISPRHARYFASLLLEHAADAEAEASGMNQISHNRNRLGSSGRLVYDSLFQVIDALTEFPVGLSVNDLRNMTGFPLAKMTRTLTTLVTCNCISRDGEGCYRLNDDFAFFPNM